MGIKMQPAAMGPVHQSLPTDYGDQTPVEEDTNFAYGLPAPSQQQVTPTRSDLSSLSQSRFGGRSPHQ